MEKQKLSPKIIINAISNIIVLLALLICILSPLAFFLAYFMFKDSMSVPTEFFLRWTCISILAVTIGYPFYRFSDSTKKKHNSSKRIPLILGGTLIQGLAMTYLFVVYQPGPDQMSRIYSLLWILFATVIHTFWVWCYDLEESLYGAIGRSVGIDSAQFSKLIVSLSTIGAISLWITIAILMVRQ